MSFPASKKAAEIEREIFIRRPIYDRRIARGELRPELAAERLALLAEIAAEYRAQQAKESWV